MTWGLISGRRAFERCQFVEGRFAGDGAVYDRVHKAYFAKQDAARALRTAALATLHEPRYRHPFYWAAFSVYGGRIDVSVAESQLEANYREWVSGEVPAELLDSERALIRAVVGRKLRGPEIAQDVDDVSSEAMLELLARLDASGTVRRSRSRIIRICCRHRHHPSTTTSAALSSAASAQKSASVCIESGE